MKSDASGARKMVVDARETRKQQLQLEQTHIPPHGNRSTQSADACPTRGVIMQETAAGPDGGEYNQVGEASVGAPAEVLKYLS